MANKTFNTRVKNKRDTAANWEAVATTFQPLDGELIIVDTSAGKTRFKVGRYDTAKGRLLYYNEIPFADEYLYNDLNESQGKIYDTIKGIDDKSIIESTLEPYAGADDQVYSYHIGLWQFPKTGFYKINLPKKGAKGRIIQMYARITKDDGTLPEDDWAANNLKRMSFIGGDSDIDAIYAYADYTDNSISTNYKVQFLNCWSFAGFVNANIYDKAESKWSYVGAVRTDLYDLEITKGDTTINYNGKQNQTVSIPTKTSELTNDSDFTTQTDLDNLTNTVVSYNAQENITDEQKAQARTNIGAISDKVLSSFTLSYLYENYRELCTEATLTNYGRVFQVAFLPDDSKNIPSGTYVIDRECDYVILVSASHTGSDATVKNILNIKNYTSTTTSFAGTFTFTRRFKEKNSSDIIYQLDMGRTLCHFVVNEDGTNTVSDLTKYTYESDVLTRTNTTAFTPTADYQPATKKYVDDNKTAITVDTALSDTSTNPVQNKVVKAAIDNLQASIDSKSMDKITNGDVTLAAGDADGTDYLTLSSTSTAGAKTEIYPDGIFMYTTASDSSIQPEIAITNSKGQRLAGISATPSVIGGTTESLTTLQIYNLANDVEVYAKNSVVISNAPDGNNTAANINIESKTNVNISATNGTINLQSKTTVLAPTEDMNPATKKYVDDTKIIVDTELSATSENPVQNKTVTAALNNKLQYKGEWDASKAGTYQLNDVVMYIEMLYLCLDDTADPPDLNDDPDNIHWQPLVNIAYDVKYGTLGVPNAATIYGQFKYLIDASTTDSGKSLTVNTNGKPEWKTLTAADVGAITNETLQTGLDYVTDDAAQNYIKYSEEQTLTDTQKTQARSNIGAASASTIETMQEAIDSKPSAADAVYTATAASTDGVAYTATVSGIDSLTVGASFIMIPNKASTSKAPTLNVNGLGAKPIRRRLSSLTTSLQQGYSTNWIALNKPFTVVYDGTAWVIEGLTKTDGADVYGAVAQATADANGNNIADTYATIAMLQSLLPKVTTITLTSNWVGDASPYYQDIALSCVTETSIVDLQPTPEQLNSWQDDGLAFTTLSGNGTVRVYVAGGKPSSAISVQVRVQEVTVI